MSGQDVERIRSGVEAFNRGDIEAVLEGLDQQVEWHVPPMLPEQTVYHGHDGVRELWQSMRDSFDDFRLVIEEIVDAGDQVMVLAALHGRGTESGIEVETPSFGWVWTQRGGKALRVDVYPNRAEALQAVGLEP